MGWVFLWLGLAFGTQIWLCIRVGRSNVALAILTFFIGFPAALYTFFKQRGDPETSVTLPFVTNVIFTTLFFATIWQTVLPLLDAQEAEFEVAAAPAVSQAAPAPEPAPASVATVAELPASAAEAAPPADPTDNFSAALRANGLQHELTRLAASQKLPPGVTDAALFAVAPRGAASAPAGEELAATLFTCESVSACRNLAGLHMQQAGASKRRVLQNGLLLLSLPPAGPDDADLTSAAVASVFRKL